jgi:hypothetical protein
MESRSFHYAISGLFQPWKWSSEPKKRLFHYPEAYGKRSAARFREVGGVLYEMHRLPRDILRKRGRHLTSIKFRLGVIR